MKYEYSCPLCRKTEVIDKPMEEVEDSEYCNKCGQEMLRVYSSPTIRTGDGLK